MISVLNRLQLLSGNKLAICCCVLVLLAGCNTQKRAVNTNNTRPTTTKPTTTTKTNTKVKEVEWTIVDQEKNPPIGAPTVIKAEKQANYTISLFVPFAGNTANSSDFSSKESQSYKFVSYYAGAKMAAEDADIKSSVKVEVFDTGANSIQNILASAQVKSSNVIVGPYDTQELKTVAQFALNNKITHISPWKSSKSIAEANPYHVQTRPSLLSHYEKLVSDAKAKFPGYQIIVLGTDSSSDKKRMEYIVEVGKSFGKQIEQYTVNQDSLMIGETAFDDILLKNKNSVVLIPNWSSEDESFIYGCVRKLRVEKGEQNVVVYGMPIMMDTDKITYDFHSNLNIHVVRSEFMDLATAKAQELRRRFYDEYKAFPTTDLYEGYDMMTYVLNNLETYGKNFQSKLGKDNYHYLQTDFDIVAVSKDGSDNFKSADNIKYYENKALKVVQFKDGKFRE
jgi:ABC-type branched-subunit amino acid transport system substrate-binding protein